MSLTRTLLFVFAMPLLARDHDLRISWQELSSWTGPSSRFQITTTDQVHIEGQILRLEGDRLIGTISKSSNPKLYSLGERSIERTGILTLALRRQRDSARHNGALIGAVVGGLLGALSGAASDRSPGNSAALGAVVGGVGGAAIWGGLGYLWGRGIDNSWTQVVLTP